jgi:hypothetical protein
VQFLTDVLAVSSFAVVIVQKLRKDLQFSIIISVFAGEKQQIIGLRRGASAGLQRNTRLPHSASLFILDYLTCIIRFA